jgi:hypothetical protein
MYKLALVFLVGAIHGGTYAQSQSESSERTRMSIATAYLEAAAQSESLQRMECGQFMFAGDRLNWDQAVSEARAKLSPADRSLLDRVLAMPSSIELRDRTYETPPKNLKILMDQGLSLDFACGLMIGMGLERNSARIKRFRALD